MSQPIWKTFADFIIRHWLDFLLAVLFAIIADLLRIGSALRAGMRDIKNKLSERSVARLRKRIAQLEKSRELYKSFLSSDKVLYLHTFQLVLAILLSWSVGAIIFIFGLFKGTSTPTFPNPRNFFSLALLPFAFAASLCAWGIKVTALNTREKVSAMVEKLDSEIADLNVKLDARLRPSA
jgi:hypothetical protein